MFSTYVLVTVVSHRCSLARGICRITMYEPILAFLLGLAFLALMSDNKAVML